MAGRVSVVDEYLLAPGDALEAPDPEACQPEHRVIESGEGAVRPEAVVGLVGQRGRVVPGVSKPEKNKLEKNIMGKNKFTNLAGMSIECESGARSQSR